MIKVNFLFFFLSFFAFMSCMSKEEVAPQAADFKDDDISDDEEAEVILEWDENFPQLRVGITTVDFLLKPKSDVDIHYIISETELEIEKVEDIKNIVENNTEESIVLSGNESINSNQDTLKVSVNELSPSTTYYAYSVLSHPEKDSLQNEKFVYEFKTNERQSIHSFQSEVENREVLYLAYQLEEGLKYSEKLMPAIIFMGGHGETANEGEINLIRNGSLPQFIDKGNDIPMYVFSPQHTQNNWNIHMINEMVDEALENYPIDPKRVYMTGISGGGFAAWNYGVEYADRIAAMVPISGGGNANKACELKEVPILAFHNENDGLVSSNGSKNMVNAVNDCPPKIEAELILFEDNGHNAWRRIYDIGHNDWNKTEVEPVNIYDWFLKFKKN